MFQRFPSSLISNSLVIVRPPASKRELAEELPVPMVREPRVTLAVEPFTYRPF